MKYLVNGVETELESADGIEISESDGRLLVRSSEGTHSAVVVRDRGKTLVSYRGHVYTVEKLRAGGIGGAGAKSNGSLLAPMPGLVVEVLVEEGQQVSESQRLLVLEAMKTQQPMVAPFAGTVERVPVSKGQQVSEGELLVRVAPHPGPE
jgi:acetyl/propionyl-CoA carboxylase alpha subunit